MRETLGIPSGERYELCRSVHAEANAIISAARRDMLGGTLGNQVAGVDVLHIRVQLPQLDEAAGELPGTDDTNVHGFPSVLHQGAGWRLRAFTTKPMGPLTALVEPCGQSIIRRA